MSTHPTDAVLFALIKEHFGLDQRRDDTVINRSTGRFHDAQRYRDFAAAMALLAKWGQPAQAQAQADSVQEDASRLDYLHSTGSTIEMLPGEVDFYPMRFRVGGLHSAVSPNLREAIDIARKQGEKQ